MTRTVLDRLSSLEGAVSVAALGGEHAIYEASADLVHDTRVVEVAVALCAEWAGLEDPARAAALLVSAASAVPVLSVRDLYDVLLESEAALPAIASGLEKAFAQRATAAGFERDLALEGWTRLALGKWTPHTLQLRGLLQSGSTADDATPPLVRALGAAVSVWNDAELLEALSTLADNEDLDADAAMELGFHSLAAAVSSTDLPTIHGGLQDALRWFDRASADEGRTDALAFKAVVAGVTEQASGHHLPDSRYQAIADAVYEYLDGYRGATRGWRGARSGTTTAWFDLLTRLRVADEDSWFDTNATLQALAHALAAEQTMVLVVNPGTADKAPQVGVRELVWPQVEQAARGNAAVIAHIRRWLAVTDLPAASDTRAAVEGLLARLEQPPSKKAGSESVRLPDSIREAFGLTDKELSALETAAGAEPSLRSTLELVALHVQPLKLAQEELLASLLEACDEQAEGGIGKYRAELTVLLIDLIRYTAAHLDLGQSTNRVPPWMAKHQPWPPEHELADDLNSALRQSGRDSMVERPDVAGGRVDIVVTFPRCRICIEVKSVDQDRTDSELVDDFGTQAVQYAVTDIPVAILVVADYVPRVTRQDLKAAIHVSAEQIDPASRQHALVTIRMQANVAPPSATSATRIRRKKLKGNQTS